MVDIKQIQYFVACAQTGSFSKAAESLYTTQPSVSKVIKAMESALGVRLFERYAKGISLTPEGEKVYRYARPILENLQKLQAPEMGETCETLLVSSNPSSWFADTFVEFYQKYAEERLHYQVYSAGIREIIQRVQERMDDIGFLYVMKNQWPAFQYFLTRNYLEFEILLETDVMLHPGARHPYWEDPGQDMSLAGLRLIQRFPDEFSPDNYWDIQDESGGSAAEAETVVTTNSDYIMERLLKSSDLVNISGNYLIGKGDAGAKDAETGERAFRLGKGIHISGVAEGQILFGYVKRRGEALPKWAGIFAEFVKNKLEGRRGE
ncbi:MAG: LysR family transcriptional regulator [Lachnospiraceae bacterium]|nr:LysR family transcriptional regulator [Lachnospiraceae bacterium]